MTASSKVVEFDKLVRALNKIIFGSRNETVTLNGIVKPTISNFLNNYAVSKADLSYVDDKFASINTAITAVTNGHKAYATLADAQASQASLPANTIVEVTNDSSANNGTYLWNGTTLTKSNYDPLAQAKLYTDSKTEVFKKNSAESLFELRDLDGNLVFDFTNDGDVIFDGGKSLKALAHKESNSVIGIPSSYEILTDDFNSLISSYRNLSHISDLPIPIGLCSQKFKISNKAEFLNLKVSQAERIKIDTPYYQDDHVVHPFLCNFYKTFRGFKHILLLTPYHNTNSIFENPCVYGSNDLLNFELLSDMPQPIYERYPGSYNYNSDNFGVYDHTTGEFCVCWRNGTTQSGFDLWMSKTSDGITWSEREQLIPQSVELLLSPNIIYNSILKKWVMYSVSNDVIHESFEGNKFNYRFANDLKGPWSEPVFIDTPFTAWHQETRYCGNQFITIVNDQKYTGQLYLGISNDGLTWEFSEVGMLEGEHLNTYKASIVPSVTENSVQFDIFWTSSNVANGEDLWQLFHAKTQPIQIEGI